MQTLIKIMKRTVLFFTTLFCLNLTYSQSINQLKTDSNGKEKLLGKINRKGLTSNSFSAWFNANYESHIPNQSLISSMDNSLKDYKIKVFLGTWCGDSKREVPKFYKVMDAFGFPEAQIEVIAVDRTSEAYKQSPTGEEKGLNIHRVPTFIFYKDGKEINRIVESPRATFEQDIKAILQGKYTPNYMAANYLYGLIQEEGIDRLKAKENELVPRLAEFVRGSRELNTMGYVSLRSGNLEEAIYIFDLNTKIFPYKSNVFDSLGEAFFEAKHYEDALKNYQKVLELKPKDSNASRMIENIGKAMKK